MKKDNLNQMTTILTQSGQWMSASELAALMHVSTKTIRNYIKELNQDKAIEIESGAKGFRIAKKKAPASAETDENRKDRILSQLLNARQGISIFDLADSLYVSEGTITADLQQLRPILATFSIKVITRDFVVALKGEEKDFRR